MSNEVKRSGVYTVEDTRSMDCAIGYARILKQCPYWYKILPIVLYGYDAEKNIDYVEAVIRTFSVNDGTSVSETICTARFYGTEFEIIES